jgi:DNA-binding NarL/FixJ family response regulator
MAAKTLIKILIVEDEGITAKALEVALTDMGYEVVGVASSAQEAIEQASRLRPHLALMDIQLKGPPDGVFTAQQIQSRLDIPVVYLTSYSDDETLKRVLHSKPYGYLVKPFEEADLREAIIRALSQHQMRQGNTLQSQ